MEVTSVLIAGLVCGILATVCAADDVERDVKAVAQANNEFGKKLLKLLGQNPGNLLISPFSLETVMAMILSGAAGRTADEMRKVLGLSSSQEEVENGFKNLLQGLRRPGDAVVYTANKLYVDKKFKLQSGYKAIATEKFFSDAAQVDMDGHPDEAADVINEWVALRTSGFIKDLVDAQVLRNTALVAVNALYFRANWSSPFDSSPGSTQPFFIKKNEKKDVWMMNQILQVPFSARDNFQAIKLKYQGDYSMVILLPNEADGIDALMDSLPNQKFEELERNFRATYVDVHLPKFSIESSLKLSEPLIQLGMNRLFTTDAELPGILNTAAALKEVLQKTFINVTEAGTEAAAATAGFAEPASLFRGPKFVADHPFVFALKHEPSGAVLFLGRYSGPE